MFSNTMKQLNFITEMSLFIFIGIVIVISFIIRGGYIISKWGELHGFYDKYGFGTLFMSFFLHLVDILFF